MRRERVFSRGGYYNFVVASNALAHREAVAELRQVIADLLDAAASGQTLQVLDLACGGEPVTIASAMQSFPQTGFAYTGVDINPDQVAGARRFSFADNVNPVRVLEDNAWDPSVLVCDRRYDLVFMGMNLHHGTPEEVAHLASRLRGLLADGGAFADHDWFRPDDVPYVRRPERDPDNPGESFRLVDPAKLRKTAISAGRGSQSEAWRQRFRDGLEAALVDAGGDRDEAASIAEHVQQRDFPISSGEFELLFGDQGFRTRVRGVSVDHPLAEFIRVVIAVRG